jgi:hypothetical protein
MEAIFSIFNIIFQGLDFIVQIVFFFVPSFLQVFSLSLAVLTIGEILSFYEKLKWAVIKYTLYIIYFFYSLYSFGVLTNVYELDVLDWSTIIMGIFAPISMIMMIYILKRKTLRGWKILNVYTIWLIYLGLATVWEILYPVDVLYGFIWIFAVFSFLLIYYFNKKREGD